MTMISVAMFNRRSSAEAVQKRLVETGIPAEIHEQWPAGVRLQAPAGEFERACKLLLEWDAADNSLQHAIRCPECKSLRVDWPQYTHKSMTTNLLIGFLVNIGAMKKEFYCYDCQYTWPRTGSKRSRQRPHMAPYYFIEGIPRGQQSASKQAA